jgi:hypothetical protein
MSSQRIDNDAAGAEIVLRPLLLATIGSGVMTLGLLQFCTDLLDHAGPGDRAHVVHGIRSSFFAFLGTSAALLTAYLSGTYRSPRLSAVFNCYGAACFLAAVVVAGGHIGTALSSLAGSPGQGVTVGNFFLFSMIGLVLLVAGALMSALKHRVRGPVLQISEPDNSNAGAAA